MSVNSGREESGHLKKSNNWIGGQDSEWENGHSDYKKGANVGSSAEDGFDSAVSDKQNLFKGGYKQIKSILNNIKSQPSNL